MNVRKIPHTPKLGHSKYPKTKEMLDILNKIESLKNYYKYLYYKNRKKYLQNNKNMV